MRQGAGTRGTDGRGGDAMNPMIAAAAMSFSSVS
jgi:hypothetical protein